MEGGAVTSPNGDSKRNIHDPQRSRATSSAATHKRTPSGGILSRLPFLRSTADARTSPTSPEKTKSPVEESLHHISAASSQQQHQRENMEPSSMAAAMRQHKARKRKGSLRKTALLSTGRLKRRTSGEQEREPVKSSPAPVMDGQQQDDQASLSDVDTLPSPTNYHALHSSTGAIPNWSLPPPSQALKLDTTSRKSNGTLSPTGQDTTLLSPESITSPISRYASTTSDDDGGSGGIHLSLGASAAELTRRRSTLRNPPILPSPSARSPSSPPPHHHHHHSTADTEYWGWIILFATWIVFVVGMGSCLGVWSWAWDVGETPYAPPELEDDPTLPIVGYYPALIVCTGVMAWVWCLVAWVGMKYFRHARFDAGGGSDD